MSFIKLFLIGILPGFSIHKLEIEKEIEQQIKYFLKCINLANKTKKKCFVFRFAPTYPYHTMVIRYNFKA